VELINVGIQELIMVLDSKSSQDGIGY
jgi:hypothetical protein